MVGPGALEGLWGMCPGGPDPVARQPPLRARKSEVLSYNVEKKLSRGDRQAETVKNA